MAEQRQLVEKEEGSTDHNPQESRLPLPFEEEEMDFTADRIKKPKVRHHYTRLLPPSNIPQGT